MASSSTSSSRRNLGIAAFAVTTLLFLGFSLPDYLGLDRSESRIPIRSDYPLHYPLLLAHIAFGTVALLTAMLQIWPWLRRTHPQVHRWSGRAYLFGGVFPSGVVVLGVTPVSSSGLSSAAGNTILAVLWLGTSWAGWRAVRQRRFADHRAWMFRSVALTFSIVVNRAWLGLYVGIFALFAPLDEELIRTAGAASVWTSWIVNLLIVEWWLLRRASPRARGARPARADADRPKVGAAR